MLSKITNESFLICEYNLTLLKNIGMTQQCGDFTHSDVSLPDMSSLRIFFSLLNAITSYQCDVYSSIEYVDHYFKNI